MTFAELITEVYTRLNESSSDPAFWTLADVKQAINDGYHTLADATEWYETEIMVPLSSFTGNYLDLGTVNPMRIDEFDTEPDSAVTAHDKFRILTHGHDFSFSSFLNFLRVFNVQTQRWIPMLDVRDLDEEVAPQWNQVQGEPQFIFLRGLFNLGIFPRTTAGSIMMRVAADPPSLDADTDVPGFPQEFQEALIEYALYDLLVQDKEVAKGLMHWQEYLVLEARLKNYVATRITRDRVGVLGESV